MVLYFPSAVNSGKIQCMCKFIFREILFIILVLRGQRSRNGSGSRFVLKFQPFLKAGTSNRVVVFPNCYIIQLRNRKHV